MFRGKKTYIQAYPILLHFALLCFIDVAFFYKWKAKLSTGKKTDWLYCNDLELNPQYLQGMSV